MVCVQIQQIGPTVHVEGGKSVPSFYPVDLGDGIEVVSLGSRHLYLLSHLASLETLNYL